MPVRNLYYNLGMAIITIRCTEEQRERLAENARLAGDRYVSTYVLKQALAKPTASIGGAEALMPAGFSQNTDDMSPRRLDALLAMNTLLLVFLRQLVKPSDLAKIKALTQYAEQLGVGPDRLLESLDTDLASMLDNVLGEDWNTK
jgi:hypothetical protein